MYSDRKKYSILIVEDSRAYFVLIEDYLQELVCQGFPVEGDVEIRY